MIDQGLEFHDYPANLKYRFLIITLQGPDISAPPQTTPVQSSASREADADRRSLHLSGVFDYSRRALALVWSTDKFLSVSLGLLTLIAGVLPAGVAYVGAQIVDAVIHAAEVHRSSGVTQWTSVVRWVAIEALLVALIAMAQRGLSLAQSLLRAQLGQRVNVMILEKALREIDMELTHRPDWLIVPLRGVVRMLGSDPSHPVSIEQKSD